MAVVLIDFIMKLFVSVAIMYRAEFFWKSPLSRGLSPTES